MSKSVWLIAILGVIVMLIPGWVGSMNGIWFLGFITLSVVAVTVIFKEMKNGDK